MILYIVIAFNILVVGMMVFLIVAFNKDRVGEVRIRQQMEKIKLQYEEKEKKFDEEVVKITAQMDEAIAKAAKNEAEKEKAILEAEQKIAQIQEDVKKKMEELDHMEEDIKAHADERVKIFEKEQREEVEKNMVSLVMNVTQKIFEKTLSYEDHKALIKKSVDDMKFEN